MGPREELGNRRGVLPSPGPPGFRNGQRLTLPGQQSQGSPEQGAGPSSLAGRTADALPAHSRGPPPPRPLSPPSPSPPLPARSEEAGRLLTSVTERHPQLTAYEDRARRCCSSAGRPRLATGLRGCPAAVPGPGGDTGSRGAHGPVTGWVAAGECQLPGARLFLLYTMASDPACPPPRDTWEAGGGQHPVGEAGPAGAGGRAGCGNEPSSRKRPRRQGHFTPASYHPHHV